MDSVFMVQPVCAPAGNSPQDCCISLFESLLRKYHTKTKTIPMGWFAVDLKGFGFYGSASVRTGWQQSTGLLHGMVRIPSA